MILTLQFFLQGAGRDEEVATTKLGKPTGALQYAYLLFLVALEVPAVREVQFTARVDMETVDLAYFSILAAVIILNVLETVLLIRRIGREPAPVESAP